jgi:uncharacterized protein with von Willebrand factor type A (vWA) domain
MKKKRVTQNYGSLIGLGAKKNADEIQEEEFYKKNALPSLSVYNQQGKAKIPRPFSAVFEKVTVESYREE